MVRCHPLHGSVYITGSKICLYLANVDTGLPEFCDKRLDATRLPGAVERVLTGAVHLSVRVGFVVGHEPLERGGHVACGNVSLWLAYIHSLLGEVRKNHLEPGCHLCAVEHPRAVERVVIGKGARSVPCWGVCRCRADRTHNEPHRRHCDCDEGDCPVAY